MRYLSLFFASTWKANLGVGLIFIPFSDALRDWEKYDDMRTHIIEPCESLEFEFKNYKRSFDPFQGAEKIKQAKALWEDCKSRANDMFRNIQKCYTTIAMIAGEEKRDFLDKEVRRLETSRTILYYLCLINRVSPFQLSVLIYTLILNKGIALKTYI